MTADKDSTKHEFVELYNSSDQMVTLSKYTLKRKTASGSESALVASTKFFGNIAPYGYFVITHPDYLEKLEGDLSYSSASYSIADNNTVLLYDDKNKLLDKVGWGTAKDKEGNAANNPSEGKSIGRIKFEDCDDNSQDFAEMSPTPGKENKLTKEEPQPQIYSDQVRINEILPHPFKGQQEFIELYNSSTKDEDMFGWRLHDASKTGEYKFLDHVIIKAKNFLVLLKETFGFALNDSGKETVSLLDPNDGIISEVSYSGSKEEISFNFDGSGWHWSKFLTPGAENILETAPEGEIQIDDDVYVNVYANFAVNGLNENAKVTWDFGDGHKSYKIQTKHKYTQTGIYHGSVKYEQGSEDVIKNFAVEVKEMDHLEVKIVAVNANPEGTDSKHESLTIQNKSKKKVNLEGWSIATGWKKNMVNHPIKVEFIIKGRKQKEITSNYSSFALNNTKAEIELRYPDGKVASHVKYKKKEGIEDNEVYKKVKGGWIWEGGEVKSQQSSVISHQDGIESSKQIADPNIAESENQNQQPGQQETESDRIEYKPTQKVEIEMLKIKPQVAIELLNDPKVLGVENVREENEQYMFTQQLETQPHYALTFANKLFTNFNSALNAFINFLK